MMRNLTTLNYCLIVSVIVYIELIDAASIPDPDDITANDCDYFQEMTITQQSNIIFNTTNIINETIEIHFDVKLANSCNSSLCNILYIGNDKIQYPSFSINGITNNIELAITNSRHNILHQIPNASDKLPADNQYYNIYLYISPNIHIVRINYSLTLYDYYQTSLPPTNISYYAVYGSDPWNEDTNASISNLCINSNINAQSHGVMNCGDVVMIEGELKSPSDINYYYFNLSETESVLLDACTSWFDTYLYVYHKANLSILYENDDDEFCKLQSVMWITSLPADEYILAISGYETFGNHDYGEWEIEIICDKHYNYSYIPLYELEISWLEAEFQCRERFGTTLATIVSEQDLEEVKMSMPNAMKYVDLWIGLYDNNDQWQWVDGTTCDLKNSTNAPCVNYDVKWRLNPTDTSKYGAFLSWFTTDRETVLRYLAAVDQQTGKNGMICNAPNGKYSFVNCENDLSHCWTDMDCCNDHILESDIHFDVFEFQPAIAVWNSQLFIVGLHQVHYTNINLFHPHIEWNHFPYHDNNQTYNKSVTQWYSQYESLLHIYVTNYTHGILISINLDNYQIESVVSPEIMTEVCVVADQTNVFILSGSTIKIYDISNKTWRESAIFHHVYAACALDQEDDYIYIFGKLEYTLYKYDIHKDVFVVLNIPNLCYTESGRGITERNDQIYLHGCGVGPWRTIIYDIKSEHFEPYSINMKNITNKNTPYYQTGQLAKFEDNVILLFHTTDTKYPSWGSTTENSEIKLYYAITDLISINVQQTQTDGIWPSDGFDIQYYINDFTNFTDITHNIWLISNTKNVSINEHIILNISNDDCICNEILIAYKCYNCYQHFDLGEHLLLHQNHINEIQFSVSAINENNTSIVPDIVTVKLQRCNMWFKNENPFIVTTLVKTNDARIEFSFNLSENCYTKSNGNFSVNITAPIIKLHQQLNINVINEDSVVTEICDKYGDNCHTLDSNLFSHVFDPRSITLKSTNDQPIEVFMKSNSIDLYIESKEPFIVQHEHKETVQIIIGVIVAVIVIVAAVACYLYCRNKKLKFKVAEQKKHKKVITNPMVLCITVGHYMDDIDRNKIAIDMHCPELDGINRDYENIRDFCRLYKYKIYPKRLKIQWTQRDIMQFLNDKANDLSDNINDDTIKRKYDSLLFFISAHGYKNTIISSDYKTISKNALHRIFSSSLPNVRLLPRVIIFDCCDGDQQRNPRNIALESSIDSISQTQEFEQVIAKNSHQISQDDELTQRELTMVENHISGEDIDKTTCKMEDRDSVWQNEENHPDFKLCLVHASVSGFQAKMNLIDGSYLIYAIIKILVENVSKKKKLFFGTIVDRIQIDLHDKGAQQITSTFNNYTRYLRFERNSNEFSKQVSATETHDKFVITEINKEERKKIEATNASKDTELKIIRGGQSYKALNTEEDVNVSDSN